MKYLIISTYPPMKCGIGKYAYQMAKKLQESGNVVNVLSPEEGDGDFKCNLRGMFNFLNIIKYSMFYDKVIIQYHESFYHDHEINRNPINKSTLAVYISFFLVFLMLKNKIEVTVHELPKPYLSKLTYTLERTKWRLCPKLIFHTQKEIEDFESYYFKLPIGKYELHSPHKYYFEFRNITSHDARVELGLPLDKIIFLCIGFIQPHKGFDRVIRAFSKATCEKMELYIVGSLRVNHGDYVAYLRDIKNMADTMPNVHVIEKYLSDEEFDTWLNASDIIVIPYREIWSSGVLGRAKLFGKPVIASDTGGLKDQLTDRDVIFRDDKELVYIFKDFSSILIGGLYCAAPMSVNLKPSPSEPATRQAERALL